MSLLTTQERQRFLDFVTEANLRVTAMNRHTRQLDCEVVVLCEGMSIICQTLVDSWQHQTTACVSASLSVASFQVRLIEGINAFKALHGLR